MTCYETVQLTVSVGILLYREIETNIQYRPDGVSAKTSHIYDIWTFQIVGWAGLSREH